MAALSTLLWLPPTLLYIAGYLLALWRIVGQLAWHFYEGGKKAWYSKADNVVPDSEQWGMALFLGAIFALAWPISLPLAYGMAQMRPERGRSLVYMPPAQRERLYRKRIAELEREAGIR